MENLPEEKDKASVRKSGSSRPVFFDPTHHRAVWVRIIAVLTAVLLWAWIISMGWYLLTVPRLDAPDTTPRSNGNSEFTLGGTSQPCPPIWAGTIGPADPNCPEVTDALAATLLNALPDQELEVYAYLPFWPEWSYISLEQNWRSIDVLLPEWYEMTSESFEPRPLGFGETHQFAIADFIDRTEEEFDLVPVVNVGKAGEKLILQLSQPPNSATDFALALLNEAESRNYDGLCLDVSDLERGYSLQMVAVVGEFGAVFSENHLRSCIVTAMKDAVWNSQAIVDAVDTVVIKGFLEPGTSSFPSPLAAQAWFEKQLEDISAGSGQNKFVLALGTHSVDWESSASQPKRLTYVEVAAKASANAGVPRVPPKTLNTYVDYVDPSGQLHQAWVLDVVSFFNQLSALSRTSIRRIAVWPIGGEDPGIWSLINPEPEYRTESETWLDSIKKIDVSDYVIYGGEGIFLKLIGDPVTGNRQFRADLKRNLIVQQAYQTLPQPYHISRWGKVSDKSVILTFDDGPDLVYTPPMLDILEETGVKATFFVVGAKIHRGADIIKRMVEDGHLIGSHSFSHPSLAGSSTIRTRLELAAVQNLLVGTTGRQTVLFRMPYGRGIGPLNGKAARPMSEIENEGYILVSSDIVPPDWAQMNEADIFTHVHNNLSSGTGNIIVLHDSGGDRANTVAALKPIIEGLRREGYVFISLADVLGVTRDDLMPRVGSLASVPEKITFYSLSFFSVVLKWIFWVVIGMGLFRSFTIIVLSQIRSRYRCPEPRSWVPVTVLVPAFCEEDIAAKCVSAILGSTYRNLKVIVVDDGSTDNTLRVLEENFGDNPAVTILTKKNGGKVSALNRAYEHVTSEVVVSIDADTIVEPDTISKIVCHFTDEKIGAVAGNVKVGNRKRLLAKFQALEYITSQNIDRRAADVLNGILVVPGAIGAWRKSAVIAAGMYSSETLAEDADLTVSIIRAGYRVVFEPEAIAHTEAPETVPQLLRQRLRWSLGMMQTGWKHKGAIREGRGVGLYSIPDIFVFGVIMSIIAPFADITFLLAVYGYAGLLFADANQTWVFSSIPIIVGYLSLPLLDIIIALIAFRLEPKEKFLLILLVPFQRFFYRQLLYISVYRAVGRALSGQFTRWQKVTRVLPARADMAGVSRAQKREVIITTHEKNSGA